MVLPAYQSLKERSIQTSLLASPTGTTRRISVSTNSVASASNLNLSSLTLSEGNHSGSHLSSYNSSNSNSNNRSATLARGWGSTETRRASTSLSTMAGATDNNYNSSRPARPLAESNTGDKDGWGYFVDVVGEEEEDALMW